MYRIVLRQRNKSMLPLIIRTQNFNTNRPPKFTVNISRKNIVLLSSAAVIGSAAVYASYQRVKTTTNARKANLKFKRPEEDSASLLSRTVGSAANIIRSLFGISSNMEQEIKNEKKVPTMAAATAKEADLFDVEHDNNDAEPTAASSVTVEKAVFPHKSSKESFISKHKNGEIVPKKQMTTLMAEKEEAPLVRVNYDGNSSKTSLTETDDANTTTNQEATLTTTPTPREATSAQAVGQHNAAAKAVSSEASVKASTDALKVIHRNKNAAENEEPTSKAIPTPVQSSDRVVKASLSALKAAKEQAESANEIDADPAASSSVATVPKEETAMHNSVPVPLDQVDEEDKIEDASFSLPIQKNETFLTLEGANFQHKAVAVQNACLTANSSAEALTTLTASIDSQFQEESVALSAVKIDNELPKRATVTASKFTAITTQQDLAEIEQLVEVAAMQALNEYKKAITALKLFHEDVLRSVNIQAYNQNNSTFSTLKSKIRAKKISLAISEKLAHENILIIEKYQHALRFATNCNNRNEVLAVRNKIKLIIKNLNQIRSELFRSKNKILGSENLYTRSMLSYID